MYCTEATGAALIEEEQAGEEIARWPSGGESLTATSLANQ
jgi:hypothetical protein